VFVSPELQARDRVTVRHGGEVCQMQMRKRFKDVIAVAKWPFIHLRTRYRLRKVKNCGVNRRLEIGPGDSRIAGFETLNICADTNVDYVWDASTRLPFDRDTFDVIYASHVLEHIPWYRTESVLIDWVRVLKPDGVLELWVPDGVKICEAFVQYERDGINSIDSDGWYRFNPDRDPGVWASGRIFSYGDGEGDLGHQNWHRAVFSARRLSQIMEKAGLYEITRLRQEDIRGYDHGWINMGLRGRKK